MKRLHLIYHLIGIFLLFCLKINSQTLVLEKWQDIYNVNNLELAIDSSNQYTFDDLLGTSKALNFQKNIDPRANFKAEQIYWGKFDIKNSLPNAQINTEWVLKFSLNFTDIETYIVDDLGNVQKGKSGFFTPIPQRSFVPTVKANIVHVNFLPERQYRVYLKMDCTRYPTKSQFDIRLISSEKYLTDLSKKKEWNSIYYGFVLMMLIYNLSLYFFAKDKVFLYYSTWLVGILFFNAYNSGNLADWLTESFFPNRPQLIHYFKLFTFVGIIGYLTFVRMFMDLPKVLPTWNLVLKWFSFLAIPTLFIDAYLMTKTNFSYDLSDRFLLTYSALFVLLIFILIVSLFRLKNNKAYFIVIGILSMGIGIILTIISRLQDIDFSTAGLKIGSTLEIITFSLGLAYRHLLNEKEKQQAHFQLEKSQLIQEQEQKEAERLKELDGLKSRLYTNITHEFRTPLTVIMGINKQIENNGKAKELIHRNSENLLQLINQMLDLAKAEEGRLTLNLIENDIINYLKYLNESFLSAAESKHIRLNFYTETPQLIIKYDEQKIQHIVQNLLSNAVKFTPAYGTIVFHTKTIVVGQSNYLQLKVKDSGIGISKEDLPNIFDRFYQSDNTTTRAAEGTGIGLALTKELVNLMKGTIKVDSELGNGSEFIIRFPYEEITEGIVEPEVINQALTTQQAAISTKTSVISEESTIKTGAVVATANGLKTNEQNNTPLLLIIEDNSDVLIYIQICLEGIYTIESARNGVEGIQKAIEIIPDVIISDIMMPEKDGYEVTQTLKQNAKTSHIPIVLLTAKATHENKLKGLKYGADAYLMKPFDKEELLIRLEKLVELRKRLQAHYTNEEYIIQKNVEQVSGAEVTFLKQLRQVILDNLAEPDFSVPQIAQIMKMSQVQVYRKLKALTGKTPSKYIRSIRMKRAMELLNTTNMNISEIAYELGFSDPNYFSRTFQQVHGKTPSSIRK